MTVALLAVLVTVLAFGAAVAGAVLRDRLSEGHRRDETRTGIGLGTATISLMTSLVLGLLLATANTTLDTTDKEVQAMAADTVRLYLGLADWGEEAAPLRAALRAATEQTMRDMWPEDGGAPAGPDAPATSAALRGVLQGVLALSPGDPGRSWLRGQMLTSADGLLTRRMTLVHQAGPRVRPLLMGALVLWMASLLFLYGLNAPRHPSVVGAFLLCSVVFGSAFFLIAEMDKPLDGLLRISPAPMERALAGMR